MNERDLAARDDILSWNRIPRVAHRRVLRLPHRRIDFPRIEDDETCLAHGNGRSYGDVCLNENGVLLRTRDMDHMIAFDRERGVFACEAGVLLGEILDVIVPQGWFLTVTPGTRHVTVGGALANDVHGKNHHGAGTFGHHVLRFELLRSSGERLVCSRDDNAGLFAASVGGLGLTGLITWVELQLTPIASPFMITQTHRFASLDDFWRTSAIAEREWTYTVAWLDCTDPRGKGVLFCGRHAPPQPQARIQREMRRNLPFDPPMSLINAPTVRAFNFAYYRRHMSSRARIAHYAPYFYPLDSIGDWNRFMAVKAFININA